MHMKFVRALVLCALGLSLLVVGACNKNTNTVNVVGPTPTGPTTITITPRAVEVRLTTNPTTGRCEATQQFRVNLEGSLSEVDVFRWTISGYDTSISTSGFARAVRAGSYAVEADIAGLHASATFTVVPGDCAGEQGPVAGPGAFTLTKVSCEVASLGRLAKISWTPSSGADRYRVMMHEWSTGAPRSLGETVGYSYEQAADLRAAVYFSVIAIGANGGETHSTPADLEVCAEAREEPPIIPPPPPTVTFSAFPRTVIAGRSTTLSWDAPGATSCVASGSSEWSGSRPVNGSQVVRLAQPGAYAYTLTCSNAGGSATQGVVVTVLSADWTVEITSTSTTGYPGDRAQANTVCKLNGVVTACPSAPRYYSKPFGQAGPMTAVSGPRDASKVGVDPITGVINFVWYGKAEICSQISVETLSPWDCKVHETIPR